jgi:hypothetical protein
MKIKLDFVTNSSTTCFVVWGAMIKPEDIKDEYYQAIADKKDMTLEQVKNNYYDAFEYIFNGTQLDFSFGPDYDSYAAMVGIYVSKMNDEETLKQFKQKVQLQILEATGLQVTPHYIEEAWRDG